MQPLMAASSCLCLVRMAQGARTTEELYRGDGGSGNVEIKLAFGCVLNPGLLARAGMRPLS